jgi:hypothetical protein
MAVVDTGAAEDGPLERPPVPDALDVPIDLAPVDGFGGNDHGRIVTQTRARVKAVYRTLTPTLVGSRTG